MNTQEALRIRHEVEAALVDYWHDVDKEWGVTAHEFYTADGVFQNSVGRARVGHAAIREFYSSRQGRGPRIARHVIANLRVKATDSNNAVADWILLLYASDGEPVLPSEPAILVGDVRDLYTRQPDGRWLIRSRTISALFKGDKPTTV